MIPTVNGTDYYRGGQLTDTRVDTMTGYIQIIYYIFLIITLEIQQNSIGLC